LSNSMDEEARIKKKKNKFSSYFYRARSCIPLD